MDAISVDRFRRKLLADKARLEELIKSINERGLRQSLFESTQELSRYDNHPGDLGSEEFERSKDLALRDNLNIQLNKIGDALTSINEGTYGRCRSCDREIPRERLEAIPETTLCLQCSEETEGAGKRRQRPIEEEVILPPFGSQTSDPYQKHPDGDEANEYDGEDVWQELGRTIEHASEAGSGSYYGPLDMDEKQGGVEGIEQIPYFKGADGMYYEDTGAYIDDEDNPQEKVSDGAGWERLEGDGAGGQ